jgi:hypothetical protein
MDRQRNKTAAAQIERRKILPALFEDNGVVRKIIGMSRRSPFGGKTAVRGIRERGSGGVCTERDFFTFGDGLGGS